MKKHNVKTPELPPDAIVADGTKTTSHKDPMLLDICKEKIKIAAKQDQEL